MAWKIIPLTLGATWCFSTRSDAGGHYSGFVYKKKIYKNNINKGIGFAADRPTQWWWWWCKMYTILYKWIRVLRFYCMQMGWLNQVCKCMSMPIWFRRGWCSRNTIYVWYTIYAGLHKLVQMTNKKLVAWNFRSHKVTLRNERLFLICLVCIWGRIHIHILYSIYTYFYWCWKMFSVIRNE